MTTPISGVAEAGAGDKAPASPRKALAARAVVAWRKHGLTWLPGMLDLIGWRVVAVRGTSIIVDSAHGIEFTEHNYKRDYIFTNETGLDLSGPDLEDGATLGCIEHEMLPALYAFGVALAPSRYDTEGNPTEWSVYPAHGRGPWARPLLGRGASKAEALVAALEASP